MICEERVRMLWAVREKMLKKNECACPDYNPPEGAGVEEMTSWVGRRDAISMSRPSIHKRDCRPLDCNCKWSHSLQTDARKGIGKRLAYMKPPAKGASMTQG